MRRTISVTLAGLAVDAFLLARCGGPGGRRPDGRAWERAASQLLWRPGLDRHQHAGVLGLFGHGPRSGARHEIDGAAQGQGLGILIECKAHAALDKSELAVFQLKCFDFYRAVAAEHPEAIAKDRWWPMLISSDPTSEAVRRISCSLGIVLCDPARMPLPALLYTAARPYSDQFLREDLLGELVRLGERACLAMQEQWRIQPTSRAIAIGLDMLTSGEIDDLLFLQDELTEDLLDVFDIHAPRYLDRRGAALAGRLEAAHLAVSGAS